MKKIKLKETGELLRIPALPVLERLSDATEADLKALIAIAALGSTGANLAETAGITEDEFSQALAFWRGAGIIDSAKAAKKNSTESGTAAKADGNTAASADVIAADAKKGGRALPLKAPDKMPEYTSAELARIIKSEEGLSMLLDECAQTYGKVLNTAELNIIIGMHDTLRLDGEYILTLLAWCRSNEKSVKYAERMAFTLTEKGVDSPAALEEYFKRKEEAGSREGFLRRLFGMGERSLTSKEEECFTRWTADFNFTDEMINLAYEKTVAGTKGKPTPVYMDKILESWHTQKITTPSQLTSQNNKKRQDEKSFCADDFLESALKRSYKKTP